MRRLFATLSALLFLQQIMLGSGVLCGVRAVASQNMQQMMSEQRSTGVSITPDVASANAGQRDCSPDSDNCGGRTPQSSCQNMTVCSGVVILSVGAGAREAASDNDAVVPAGRTGGPLTRSLSPEPPPPRT